MKLHAASCRRVSGVILLALAPLLLPHSEFPLGQAEAAELSRAVGQPIEPFVLNDYRGKQHRLEDYADSQLIVLAVVGSECPLAKLYGPRLADLAKRYEPQGVTFLGLNANVQDSITEIAAYARLHGIEFPILKDLGNQIVDRLGAERTPEVFVLDQQLSIRYRGRIDDQYGVGYARDEPTRHELATAIDQLLAGRPVETPVTEAVGCHIGRVRKPQEGAAVTYSDQVARILQQRCVTCHREGEIAPFALTSYDEVVGWAEMIEEVVREQRMPPWHADPAHGSFKNERLLSDEEKQALYDWVAAGAPQGDPSDLPPPIAFTTAWQLPREPDLVIPVTSEPYRVPAEGTVRYQYFRADPGFTEDKWVTAAELQPGNRAVVHHILAFARPAGSQGRLGEDAAGGYLAGYVPGLRVEPYPAGMAKRIPAGSELVFQVHYTPIGTEQFDQSHFGLVFADPDSMTHEVKTTSAVNPRIRIPAQAGNHGEEADNRRSIPESHLLALMPHMHLRGKSFLYEAHYPDGSSEILLDVPRYDFNWQTAYHLSEPKKLPAGTRIHCVAHYDNSEHNLHNPDPSAVVRWGDQTWEEMMIGYFDLAIPLQASGAAADGGAANTAMTVQAAEIIRRLDKDNDGALVVSELPERFQAFFERIDRDGDDHLSKEELAEVVGRLRQ